MCRYVEDTVHRPERDLRPRQARSVGGRRGVQVESGSAAGGDSRSRTCAAGSKAQRRRDARAAGAPRRRCRRQRDAAGRRRNSRKQQRQMYRDVLEVYRKLGAKLTPVDLPDMPLDEPDRLHPGSRSGGVVRRPHAIGRSRPAADAARRAAPGRTRSRSRASSRPSSTCGRSARGRSSCSRWTSS